MNRFKLNNIKGLLLVSGMFLLSLNSSGQESAIQSDRPGQTFSSSTIEKNAIQIQTGLDWNPVDGMDDIFQTPLYLRYGLFDRFEVNGAITPIFNKPLAPYPSFEAGIRYHIVQNDRFNLTGQARYLNVDGIIAGPIQSAWGQANLSYNFGAASLSSTFAVVSSFADESLLIQNSTDLYSTLNLGGSLGSEWGFFVEIAALNFFQGNDSDASQQLGLFEGMDWGFAWTTQPNVQLDFATDFLVSRFVTDGIRISFVSVGVSWKIEN
jgi:hypothetical protein